MQEKIALLLKEEGAYPQNISRSSSTIENYTKRALQLIKRASKNLGIPCAANITSFDDVEIDPREFVSWLIQKKPELNHNSWRQYKSACMFFLEKTSKKEAASEAIDLLKCVYSNGTNKHTNKTSATKSKKIKQEDFAKLIEYLETHNKKWHKELIYFLKASIITGLRPCEWKDARLETSASGETVLVVKNAKNSNMRAFGETRTLIFKNVSEEDLKNIKLHLNNAKMFASFNEYNMFYVACQTALRKANKGLWRRKSRHITLYSMRHQFSANAKASMLKKNEVAALMGHAVDTTAAEHYGKKRHGKNGALKIAPSMSDVSKVIIKSDNNAVVKQVVTDTTKQSI